MRKLLIIGAAFVVAAPIAAQPASNQDDRPYEAPMPEAVGDDEDWDEEDWDEEDFDREELRHRGPPVVHPGEVQVMAGAMDRLLGAVMDLPIGGIAAAVDPYGRGGYHPGATVRDMATRDDPFAEQRMRAGIHGATRGIGSMSQALARMMPVLERSFEEVGREIEAAMGEVDGRRPY